MPYDSIDDLPDNQTSQYSKEQKKAFLNAFNSAEEQGDDESTAFAKAHGAAKNAGDDS